LKVDFGNEMDGDTDSGRLDFGPAKAKSDGPLETLARFQSRSGFQIQVAEYQKGVFQALVGMYEDFEPKRGAQGLPPVGYDRLVSWLLPLCDNNLNLIALFEDRVIGHAVLCALNGGRAEFAIFLHQDFRNQGIGSSFTEVTLQYGRTKGLRHVWLTVEVNNFSAIRVYKKMGFRISGTYYPEVEMILDLDERQSWSLIQRTRFQRFLKLQVKSVMSQTVLTVHKNLSLQELDHLFSVHDFNS
jgi:GNAT superfamily N-acetyltransferase